MDAHVFGGAKLSRFDAWKRIAVDVDGWFSDEAAALFDFFLAGQSSAHFNPAWTVGDCLEIGVAYGKAALMMAIHTDNNWKIRLVDVTQLGAAARLRAVTSAEVIEFTALSEAMPLESMPSRSTRFMHIDGDHGRWALHNDLDIANRVVTYDGMVVLDDFFSAGFVGVTVGAIEWMARNPHAFELILVGFNKGYMVRPRFARAYLEAIRDHLPAHLWGCGVTDFSLFRTDDRRACACFGITGGGQFDGNITTRERAAGWPDDLIEGKIRI